MKENTYGDNSIAFNVYVKNNIIWRLLLTKPLQHLNMQVILRTLRTFIFFCHILCSF
ncbi:hypothetical protein BDC45DRAFT_514613 [Circinella umbellata]|nr:hypothetical protein BDC45DRAFT_514613 [Circinella umbellata]